MYVCVCVCVRERGREREGEIVLETAPIAGYAKCITRGNLLSEKKYPIYRKYSSLKKKLSPGEEFFVDSASTPSQSFPKGPS